MILSYPDFVPSFSPFSHIARSIIYQLLLAIEYLHSDEVGIAHRDVNPSNVAVDGNGCVKLLDFGVAFEYGCGMEDEHPNGGMYFELATGAYRAPELLFGSRAYDAKSTDLWSLGVTLSTFFSHLTSYNCSTSPRTNSTSSISSSISTSSQGGLVRLDAPITLPGLPDMSTRRQSFHKVQNQSRWSRKTLFDASHGEIGLASSILSVRGPITNDSWPVSTYFITDNLTDNPRNMLNCRIIIKSALGAQHQNIFLSFFRTCQKFQNQSQKHSTTN